MLETPTDTYCFFSVVCRMGALCRPRDRLDGSYRDREQWCSVARPFRSRLSRPRLARWRQHERAGR